MLFKYFAEFEGKICSWSRDWGTFNKWIFETKILFKDFVEFEG